MTTETVTTKEEFKEKMSKMKKDSLKKKTNPNHKVFPNLTPRGKDILSRLNNKSLNTEGERSYTQSEEIINARYMSKHELAAAAKANAEKIEGLKKTLNETAAKAETAIKESQSKKE